MFQSFHTQVALQRLTSWDDLFESFHLAGGHAPLATYSIDDVVFSPSAFFITKEQVTAVLQNVITTYWPNDPKTSKRMSAYSPDTQYVFWKLLNKGSEALEAAFRSKQATILFSQLAQKSKITFPDVTKAFGVESNFHPNSALMQINLVHLDNVTVIIPSFDLERTQDNVLYHFAIYHTLFTSEFTDELIVSEQFCGLWKQYMFTFTQLRMLWNWPTKWSLLEHVQVRFYQQWRNKQVLLPEEINAFKKVFFTKLLYIDDIESIVHDPVTKRRDSGHLSHIDVIVPQSYADILLDLNQLYPYCDEVEQTFIQYVLFSIEFQQQHYQKAINRGERLMLNDQLRQQLLTFQKRYLSLPIGKENKILHLAHNTPQSIITWKLLESYVQLQQLEEAKRTLFYADTYPIPLLKLYEQAAQQDVAYQWSTEAIHLYQELAKLPLEDLHEVLERNVFLEQEPACFAQYNVQLTTSDIFLMLQQSENLFNPSCQSLADVSLLLPLARVLYGTSKEVTWTNEQKQLKEDLRALFRFHIHMEISLHDKDLFYLKPRDMDNYDSAYYQMQRHKDFAHRLVMLIKILIHSEHFTFATYAIELFKHYFYQFEELKQLDGFYMNALLNKNKHIEFSVMKKLQEAITLTSKLDDSLEIDKQHLLQRVNMIYTTYAQIGESVSNFMKFKKDELVYNLLKKHLKQEEIDTIIEKMGETLLAEVEKYSSYETNFVQIKSRLNVDFDGLLEKLEPETVQFLISGLMTFDELAPIESDVKIDYSGAIILLSKAVENELKTKLLLPYAKSFEPLVKTAPHKIPYSLLKNRQTKEMREPKDITIGSLRHVLGIHRYGVNEMEKTSFLTFCASRFKDSVDLEKLFYKELIGLVDDLCNNFRNKAAHTVYFEKVSAEACIALVTSTKKIMHLLTMSYK